ncbi:C10 family peptidase [Desulfobacula sp.]|uniref:C10 family peptidase n=1 Tax=Desulfobacula sp. TaxID=2593537 RepID=UPI00262593DD|nr:C10 family peptidase [Desulfobacula sp.]
MSIVLRSRQCFLGLVFYWMAGVFSTALALTSQDQATLAAKNLLGFLGSAKTIVATSALNSNRLDSSQSAVLAGWVMDLNDGGYLLISSSPSFSPVKAYSLKNAYTSLPVAYRQFLEQELELYARLETETQSTQRTSLGLPEKTRAETAWAFLLNTDPADRRTLSYAPDTHLLTTTWNQGYPYNKFLPKIDGQSVLAGCVNIAVAQVMKYHGYPDQGAGATTYAWNNESLSAVLQHPYYWANMPDDSGMAMADHLQDEVAILIRDLAIVNHTTFGLTYSSAYLHKDDFVRFFGYANALSSMDNTNGETFFATLKGQIDAELPVLLSFPGHMVVVDGYASDPTGRKFHVNMGWGGLDDDYYFLDQAVTTSSYIFQPDLEMIYNIKPCSGPDCVTPQPPSTDIAPQLNTVFKDIFLPADEPTPHLIRLDARDENGDAVTFSTILSNTETITTDITNDILTIQPVPGSQNKAATVRITAQAGGKSVTADFRVMVADQDVTFGRAQTIKGLFENQEDINTHTAILEGDCAITGDRGYSNQAFYISVRDSQGTIVIPDTDGPDTPLSPAIEHSFPFGRYTLSASLRSGYSSYSYTQGSHDAYVIKVTAPQADADIEQVADLMGIDLTQIHLFAAGDINNDGQVSLEDKLLALKIITCLGDTPAFDRTDDANGDGRIGIEEALFWDGD